MTVIFASAPDTPLGNSPEVWVENDRGLLAALSPAQAREFAEELKDAADYAEDLELHAMDESHHTYVEAEADRGLFSAACHDCKWIGPYRDDARDASENGRDHEALMP